MVSLRGGPFARLKKRVRRQRLILRAILRRRALVSVVDRTSAVSKTDILAFFVFRNESDRLPFFLDYYRRLGVTHFFAVDNDSTDGGADLLKDQPDVSLWHTRDSYKDSRFGMDWVNWLLFRYGHGHWCLTVDPDEFLVYPHHDTRSLVALTDWLNDKKIGSFSAMLLDMYAKDDLPVVEYQPGGNPFDILCWFDPYNYTIKKNGFYGNLWVQGGVRRRVFFSKKPKLAPALNKIPLVKWDRRYCYVSSTHMLLPSRLNKVYATDGGEKICGCLLHSKFTAGIVQKSIEEIDRRQHYGGGREYDAYLKSLTRKDKLWCSESMRYEGWRQLVRIGLMSTGGWV
ncbi:glycosyltransferase family 2 protein [Paracoccus sp. (in: a-proteobacteria)]|uniref:glycosyltransferase family 2 protein n=1 Tax=Paracoccus sp. TaxID=267 RepID=UPI0026DF1349|nr:glycosyltransferase family 2 protein [Paracoccus sp. (in: a-proteobacteria)]MDO5648881.1 glycosyltransferase family 2 protein [Paracoccus sp. (in: a-proteobacteria)]